MALIGLILCAKVAFAAPGLSLHISGPQTVDGIENLKLLATVTNTGDDMLKLLNDTRGLLNAIPTRKFVIRNVAGQEPSFTGVVINYAASADDSLKALYEEEDVIFLAPGESVDVEHDLSEAYDFSSSGPGSYSFGARNLFHYIDSSTSAVVPIYAHMFLLDAYISGRLGAERRSSPRTELAAFTGCEEYHMNQLKSLFPATSRLLNDSITYIQNLPSGESLYTLYFGTYEESRRITVFIVLNNIRD
jgi:peptidyl-Lys metalloendopeptidase